MVMSSLYQRITGKPDQQMPQKQLQLDDTTSKYIQKTSNKRSKLLNLCTVVIIILFSIFLILYFHLTTLSSFTDFVACEESRNINIQEDNLLQDQKLPVYSGPPATVENKLTFILNTYKRHHQLINQIRNYEKCECVHEFIIVWCEDSEIPDKYTSPEYYSGFKNVRYERGIDSGLNNRFLPFPGIQTEAILSIDDDIVMSCDSLEQILQTWQQKGRDQLVGVFPRDDSFDESCEAEYDQKWATYGRDRYSIILTKTAIFKRDYLELYSNWLPQQYRDYVNENRNCEDILMQFLVANVTQQAPLLVKIPWIVDLGAGAFSIKGISSSGGHAFARSDCLNDFMKMNEGHMPLKKRNINGGWFWFATPLLQDISNCFTIFFR